MPSFLHENAHTVNSKLPKPPVAASTIPPPPPEDQVGDGGESIATFANYRPATLPSTVADILNGKPDSFATNNTTPQPEIIDLIDDDETQPNTNSDDNDMPVETDENTDTIEQPQLRLSCPSHTSLACESALLSSVRAPLVSNQAAECLLEVARNKALSPLQLEGALLAIQRHCRFFSGNIRAGFFIGDGAGVGKGRQISAIIRDSLCRKGQTRRHVWFSVSRELVQDAKRDLRDVGVHCEVHDGTELLDKSHGLGIPNKGVLFCTYQLLVSSKRMEQIVSWCAGTNSTQNKSQHPQMETEFDGCVILDEAHKAKNLRADSRTAQLVIEIQRRLPKARVVYCSATGVSDVGHMVYAERLGLWRTNSNQAKFSLFESFAIFQRSLDQRGLGSLEMLALEMKQQGSFMARTLSWDGAEFETLQIPLNFQQQTVYDSAVRWWIRVKIYLEDILNMPVMKDSPPNKMIWRIFWSSHQRFFKELAICAKIPYLAKDAKRMAAQNCCVIFGLQSTGDAGMQSILEQNPNMEQFPALLSTVGAVMINFIQNHFPVAQGPPEISKLPDQPPPPNASFEEKCHYALLLQEMDRIKNIPPPQAIPELVAIRHELLLHAKSIELPPNPLDDLIDRLGGIKHVSELTGRSGRIVRLSKKRFVYSKRGADIDASERINLVEKRAFMNGEKSFAIISDAASTGISLHAARGSTASHKRRIHYTIELPWSADKAVQQLGRSHRSGQESAPIYKLVVTDLGGERRFAAAVSKRMASLGALTKGDRRAATGSDMLSDFDLDSRYGKKALKRFYNNITNATNADSFQQVIMPSKNTEDILDAFYQNQMDCEDLSMRALSSIPTIRRQGILSLVRNDLDDIGLTSDSRKQNNDVKVFLNRIFGLPVARQNLLFSLFVSTMADIITEAKMTGEFEGSAEDIKAASIEILDERVLVTDPSCDAETKLTTLVLDRGISLETVCNMAKEEALEETEIDEHEIEDIATSEETKGNSNKNDNNDSDEKDKDIQTSQLYDADDEWLSTRQFRRKIAKPGFYISKKKFAGRFHILFAKEKFPTRSFKDETEAAQFDSIGWMTVTRPNTGTNPNDMRTRDLDLKYRLALGCDRLRELLKQKEKEYAMKEKKVDDSANKQETSVPTTDKLATCPCDKEEEVNDNSCKEDPLLEIIKQEKRLVISLWDATFNESNYFLHTNGLAPRRSKVGLVTGAVLHILPTLENVVIHRSEKERSLKIMRAEVPISANSTRRLVGVRFPVDGEALFKLESAMESLRNDHKAAGKAFYDESIKPIDEKSTEWATVERNTIKTFFKAVQKNTSSKNSSTSSHSYSNHSSATNTKRSALDSSKITSNKRVKSIASFFMKK